MLLVMCGPERFHPVGSWSGWMTTSKGNMDGLLWCVSHHLVIFPLFLNSEPLLSCQVLRFVIIKPFGADLDLIYILYSRLAFVWVLMHMVDPLWLCKWFHRVWPGNLRQDDTLLLLNDQRGLVLAIVSYFPGRVVTPSKFKQKFFMTCITSIVLWTSGISQ
jgi:hypothetical protein